ncbi:DUF4236 domain-containing protein [Clostridium sp. CCUG 7971]|uniref:DUF4236 domain-containing protein n=1 Tax=Clostridium sp. CCUG 7971 TaxID=2811414 RepID=UPI001ABB9410|nr:DUF4236 domain-containing protein [Clostridium sp. CCUG 7971]
MGFRFRKSINLGGGVKLNVSKKSVGLSAGVKGARVSVNSNGRKTTTVGLGNTGLSYTKSSNIINNNKVKGYKEIREVNTKTYSEKDIKRLKLNYKVYKISGIIFICLGLLLAIPASIFGILVALVGVGLIALSKGFKDILNNLS